MRFLRGAHFLSAIKTRERKMCSKKYLPFFLKALFFLSAFFSINTKLAHSSSAKKDNSTLSNISNTKTRALAVGLGKHMTSKLWPWIQENFSVIYGSRRSQDKLLEQKIDLDLDDISTNYHDFLDKNKIDAIIVAGSPEFHSKVAKEALQKNIPIFVEKPLSFSIDKIRELNKLAKEKDGAIFVGFNLMHLDWLPELKSTITDNDISYRIITCTLGEADKDEKNIELVEIINKHMNFAHIHALSFLEELLGDYEIHSVNLKTGPNKNQYLISMDLLANQTKFYLELKNYHHKPGFNFTYEHTKDNKTHKFDIKEKNAEGMTAKQNSYKNEMADFAKLVESRQSSNLDKVIRIHKKLDRILELLDLENIVTYHEARGIYTK